MKKNIVKMIALALAFSTVFSTAAFAAKWDKLGDQWFYYLDDGTVAKNTWVKDVSEDGTVISSYWVKNNGVMAVSEWVHDGEAWYYVDGTGLPMKDQLLTLNSELYWVDEDGKMVSESWKQSPEGKWYYLQADGKAYKKGWKTIEGEEYYFLKSGVLAVDALVDGCRVDASGRKAAH